jgi:2-polyprenyl-6-methoxyphenol hydroxylase-like FAD-dependent oxidoreductase
MHARRHAEIAGAGIGGLTAATALALRGWSVRVHERAAHLRDIGVGTSLWENGHKALAVVGALDEVVRCGTRIGRSELYDERGERLKLQEFDEKDRARVVLRVDLHRALVEAAQRAGVEIVTSSPAASATPDGTLVMESGERHAADLVLGCDGYYSKIRDSLGLAEEVGFVTEAWIGRVTVPRAQRQEVETIHEYWAGLRACGMLSCGEVNYMFLSAPEDCAHNADEVRAKSLNKQVWSEAFPFLAEQFARAANEVVWGRYPIVRCKSWSTGRAAILGDSAHGMPPTLAQGAGCAMANAIALAANLTDAADVAAALRRWEARERPITEITQRWAVLYITVLKRWPQNLLALRSGMVAELFSSPAVVAHLLSAARHVVPAA